MGAPKKYPSKLTKRKQAAEKKPALKIEKRIKRGTPQDHTISRHAVLLCTYFT